MITQLTYIGTSHFVRKDTGSVKYCHYFADEIYGGRGCRPFGMACTDKDIVAKPGDKVDVDVTILKDYNRINIL